VCAESPPPLNKHGTTLWIQPVIHAESPPPYALNHPPLWVCFCAESPPFSALNSPPPKPVRLPLTFPCNFFTDKEGRFLGITWNATEARRLLGASPPPAPTAYGLRPRYALPARHPPGLRPRATRSPNHGPPQGVMKSPAAPLERGLRLRLMAASGHPEPGRQGAAFLLSRKRGVRLRMGSGRGHGVSKGYLTSG
jgi:hypothetical protein